MRPAWRIVTRVLAVVVALAAGLVTRVLAVVVALVAVLVLRLLWPKIAAISYPLGDMRTCGVDLPLPFLPRCVRPVESLALLMLALAVLFLGVALVARLRAWHPRLRHAWLAIAALLLLLALATAYPVALTAPSKAVDSRCGGTSVWVEQESLCASPDLLTGLIVGALFITSAGLVVWGRTRRWLPEIVVVVFAALAIGGVWLRDVRSPPGFTRENRLQLRLKTSDLANGAALVRPNEFVRLVLVGQGDLAQESYGNLQVLGLYAGDHSVAFTGELPDSILLAVPQDKVGAILAALADKKRPAYLQGQSGEEAPPTPAPTSPAAPVTFPLPVDKIREYDPSTLADDGKVVVVAVVQRAAAAATGVPRDAHLFNARVAACNNHFTFVTLDRGPHDNAVKELAQDVAAAGDIYLLRPPPVTPSSTPTVTPTAVAGTPTAPPATDTPTLATTATPTPTSTPCPPNSR